MGRHITIWHVWAAISMVIGLIIEALVVVAGFTDRYKDVVKQYGIIPMLVAFLLLLLGFIVVMLKAHRSHN
jgi:hypothetical protein